MRSDPKTLVFGLNEFTDPGWQSWWGMTKTPFVNPAWQSEEVASEHEAPLVQESEDTVRVSRG
jgi:hypothetical protein